MKEQFIQIISDISYYNIEDMSFDLSLLEDLALGSVMLVELVATLEETFMVSLENCMGEIVSCETVGELYQYIVNKIQNGK